MICTKCGIGKPLEYFSYRDKLKGVRHKHCKQCQKEASNKHYRDNKKDYIERAKKWNSESVRRAAIARNSYAKLKGYEKCTCCTQEAIDKFLVACPKGFVVDHIDCLALGGKHCLLNLQYLKYEVHQSKSSKERALYHEKD